jgi:hypothetical protein
MTYPGLSTPYAKTLPGGPEKRERRIKKPPLWSYDHKPSEDWLAHGVRCSGTTGVALRSLEEAGTVSRNLCDAKCLRAEGLRIPGGQ